MTGSFDSHEPTPEFRAHIKREIARAVRTGDPLGTAPALRRTRRVATAVGIAAGVALTLVAGMVVGASASYASAAVLDEHQREASTSVLAATRQLMAGQLSIARANYDRLRAPRANGAVDQHALAVAAAQVDTLERMLARIEVGLSANRASAATTRSALAILPIKSALNALGCTQNSPAPSTPVAAAVVTPEVIPEHTAAIARRNDPDRARIAALATEHLPAVVRGDTASDYIVMVLDATDKYLWSTHGSGNLSLVVGGDTRTSEDRVAYMREHSMQYTGTAQGFVLEPGKGGREYRIALDSLQSAFTSLKARRFGDSTFYRRLYDSLVVRSSGARGSAVVGSGARGGGARGGGDSITVDARRYVRVLEDSLLMKNAAGFYFGRGAGTGTGAGGGRGGASVGVSPVNAADGSYRIGWGSARTPASNAANGLEEAGNGLSGVFGLPATSISMGESYAFAAGELAPQVLRVVVLHLAPGTAFKGR